MGVRLPTAFARAAIAVAIGVVRLSVALAMLHDTSSLGNFLLVTAYWTGPWLGVVLADRLLVRTWPAPTPAWATSPSRSASCSPRALRGAAPAARPLTAPNGGRAVTTTARTPFRR